MDFYDRYGRYAYDGESWCVQKSDSTIFEINQTRGAIQILPGLEPDLETQNLPGTEYYRLICQDGRVTKPELCMPRGEVCAETTMEYDFLVAEGSPVVTMQKAVCMVNRHEFCVDQTNQADCEDTFERDCEWVLGYSIQKDEEGKSLVYNDSNGNGKHDMASEPFASCLPKIPPATDATCAAASESCVVEYMKRGVGKIKKEHCIKNCYCLEGFGSSEFPKSSLRREGKYDDTNPEYPSYRAWAGSHEEACLRLGDCGVKVNYRGDTGVNTKWVIEVENPPEEEE